MCGKQCSIVTAEVAALTSSTSIHLECASTTIKKHLTYERSSKVHMQLGVPKDVQATPVDAMVLVLVKSGEFDTDYIA